MTIKFHPYKSNNTIRKTPIVCITYEELEKAHRLHGNKGKYIRNNVDVPQEQIIQELNEYLVAKRNAINAEIQKRKEEALAKIKLSVQQKCTEEEAKMFWLLYNNLTAEYIASEWGDGDPSIELCYKGIPL